MLVLSRKNDQSVVIGDSAHFEQMVRVTVLESSGASVKLGFEANKDVVIHREEVWGSIRANDRVERPAKIPVTPKQELDPRADET